MLAAWIPEVLVETAAIKGRLTAKSRYEDWPAVSVWWVYNCGLSFPSQTQVLQGVDNTSTEVVEPTVLGILITSSRQHYVVQRHKARKMGVSFLVTWEWGSCSYKLMCHKKAATHTEQQLWNSGALIQEPWAFKGKARDIKGGWGTGFYYTSAERAGHVFTQQV